MTMTNPVASEREKNEDGATRCVNCRRWIPAAYDADYCVFGRHPHKTAK